MTPQAKEARMFLGKGRLELCRQLGITVQTLARAENTKRVEPLTGATRAKLQRFYEAAGVEFKSRP